MEDYDTCNAVCAEGEPYAGSITCFNGALMGQSVCGLAGNYSIISVETVRGTMALMVAGPLTLETMQQGLSAALGVEASKVIAYWQNSGGRRLQDSSSYNVRYETRVPPGVSSNELLDRIKQLNDENSTTLSTFTSKLSDAGVSVQDLTVSEPEAVALTVFADPTTGQEVDVTIPSHSMPTIIPSEVEGTPAPTPVVSPDDSSGGDAGGGDDAAMMPVIIGGAAGGGCCCLLCIGATIFIIRRRKMQEA